MAVVWNWLALCCFTVLVSSAFGSECDTASVLDRIYGQYTDNTLAEGWYKVPRHELADDPLKSGDCATKYPIWGSGQFPDDGMESDVTACVVSETKSCARNFTIRVKDCDDFEVYYLKPTSSSDEAYCFKHDDEDDDDDDDCEERRHHGKKFHKCHRNSRHFVVVIGIVVLVIAAVAIAAFIIYRRRKAAILKRQDMYKDKEAPTDNGPVVVTTDGGLPPKKY